MSNILIAFSSLVKNTIKDLKESYIVRSNRANSMGDSLEEYIKDLFCDSFSLNKDEAFKKHQTIFSYLGNQNNPPDAILINSDAIEVKKIESHKNDIALNSSYPKDYLYKEDLLITKSCREVDGGHWNKKDIIYIIGIVNNNSLNGIWFIYGDCYAADRETYTKIKNCIAASIKENCDLELSSTKEIARVNKVDPLGITYLRVRGMWGIQNPNKVYSYLKLNTETNYFFAHLLLKESKYNSFSQEDKDQIELLHSQNKINKQLVKIRNPNNPAQNIDAIVLSYNIS